MTANNRSRNRALVRYLLLPTIFLAVALLGGLRVSAETRAFVFIAPPLVTLVLAMLLMLLFVRGRLVEIGRWLSSEHPAISNISHALTLAALFFASAQAFNSVLPERGLMRWMFSFFFLWTLWNNQFSSFNALRLLRSLAALFGTAFVLKHMLLASLAEPEGGWLKRLAGVVLEGITGGSVDVERFAPSTGYISFFTLALYVAGLILLPPAPAPDDDTDAHQAAEILHAFQHLPTAEQATVREAILAAQLPAASASPDALSGGIEENLKRDSIEAD